MEAPWIQRKIELPENVEAGLSGKSVEIRGPKGKLSRTFDIPGITLVKRGQTIVVRSSSNRRRYRALVGTVGAHIKNMIKGVLGGFTYKLRVVYSHFPITVKVEDKRVMIHNFLGEKKPRVARIVGDVDVKVEGDEIIVYGINKEEVGQTAINIEQATRIKRRDPRVFQDGCYIVERG
ncbi:MAG: 50S ribosomal protein L6 [Hadesarchaea archaeon]|nr:50S ribosomal protein L6 [Hadesarchaea archaeon]